MEEAAKHFADAMAHLESSKFTSDPHISAKRIQQAQKFLSLCVEKLYQQK